MRTTTTIAALIEVGIANSSTYTEYRTQVREFLAEGKSTGAMQSEELTAYSILNDRRMKRLDKTIKISSENTAVFAAAKSEVVWLVLTEGWCGDAAQSLPVINKLSELNDGITLRIASRDTHSELMQHFLTNGGEAIPKLIAYDPKQKKVLGSWGPRPTVATTMVNAYKEQHGGLDAQFKEDLQVWYNKDKGHNITADLLQLMQAL